MVKHKGVKVTIVRYHDKQPYNEYKPKKKATAGHRKAKTTYIEAVSGERFAVVVEILPGFNFKSSRHLQITAAVDECVQSSWTIDAKDVNGPTAATTVEDRQVVWDSEERLIDGKWNSYGLTFAALKIDDGAELTEEEILDDRKSHGRVTVTVARGTRVNCEPYISPSVQSIEETPTSSRDVVAKHHVSHTTKLVRLGECEPLLNTFMFNPRNSETRLKGGPAVQFIFRARSKQSLRLLDIKSKRPVLPPEPPSAPGLCNVDTAAKAKSSSVHARCEDDDDEQPCPKKIKVETVAGAQVVKLVLERPHTSPQPATEGKDEHKNPTAANAITFAQAKPHPQSVTEGNNEQKDSAVADAAPVAQSTPHPQPSTEGTNEHKISTLPEATSMAQSKSSPQPTTGRNNEHREPNAADATSIAHSKPHLQPPTARNEPKPNPITIKDESDDEGLLTVSATPVSRAHSTSTPAQAQISVAPVQHEDQAKRERRKAILKMRLEQLNIDREQLKIEQELLEMED
ncbi:hypothetical protein MBLNU13_g10878t1 [Cladosporium sp. NU13]